MKEILLTFITDYSDRRTRPYAHAIALQYIEHFRMQLSDDQVRSVFETMMQFTTKFTAAWPWNKSKVTVEFIRKLN